MDHIAGVRGPGGILCDVVCNLRLAHTGRILNENGYRATYVYVHGIVKYICIIPAFMLSSLKSFKILPTLLSIALIPNSLGDWEGGQLLQLPGVGLVREPTPKVTLKIQHTKRG